MTLQLAEFTSGGTPEQDFATDPYDQWLAEHTPKEICDEILFMLQGREYASAYLTNTARLFVMDVLPLLDPGEKLLDIPSFESVKADVEQQINELDTDAWERCIDTDKPTIGLRAGLANAGLLAVAANRLRQQGEDICNIVILPDVAYGLERHDETAYYAQRGIIADADGRIYAGDFPEAIQIDAVSHSHDSRLEGKVANISFINSPEDQQISYVKPRVQERLAAAGVPHVEALVSDIPADDPQLHATIRQRAAEGRLTVVKPVDASLGQSVFMIKPDEADEQLQQIQAGARDGQLYMAEPWIESPPLHFPETGVRADWNIRSFIAGGQLVGIYARVGVYGEAVNYSRGAVPRSLDWIMDQYGMDDSERQTFVAKVENLSNGVAAAFPDSNIIGIDILADESMEPLVLEKNGENSGGIYNIMQLEKQDGLPSWRAAGDSVRAIHNRLFPTLPPPHNPTGELIDPTTIADIIRGVRLMDHEKHAEQSFRAAKALLHIWDNLTPAEQALAAPLTDAYKQSSDGRRPTGKPAYFYDNQNAFAEVRIRHELGDTETTFYPANEYVRHEPSDLMRQQAAASMVLHVYPLADELSKWEFYHEIPAQSPVNAIAIGRAACMTLMDRDGNDVRSLQTGTIFRLTDAFAEFFSHPPHERQFVDAGDITDHPGEQAFLSDLLQVIHIPAAIARNDHREIRRTLIDDMDEVKNDIANEVRNPIASVENPTEEQQLTLFLLDIALHSFPYAYSYLTDHPRDNFDDMFNLFRSSLSRYIEDSGFGTDSQEHGRYMEAIMLAMPIITVGDEQTAYGTLARLMNEVPITHKGLDWVYDICEAYLSERFDSAAERAD